MSFSSDIKEELSKVNSLANKTAVKEELIGYLISSNTDVLKNKVRFSTENQYSINRFNKLLNNMQIDYKIDLMGKLYAITFKTSSIINGIEYEDEKIKLSENIMQNKKMIEEERALIRGCFLGAGTVSDPHKTNHLEMIFRSEEIAKYIIELLAGFNISCKIMKRRATFVIYTKDGDEISKLLAFMEASFSVIKFEEVRVIRDMRNNVNRLVNCETANLNKTIEAAVNQMEDIKLLKNTGKFETLPKGLKEIAEKRLENPEASLIELGNLLEQPIGKSGVNHRLRKLTKIAEEVRNSMK